MSDERPPDLLDRIVERIAGWLDAIGLNGTRLRWRWNRRRRDIGESGAQSEQWLRSARAKHKMCPECRELVPRDARLCTSCGESLAGVSKPGVGRAVGNLLPGISSATPLILLVNGALFALTLMATLRSGGAMGLMGLDGEVLLRFGSGFNGRYLIEDDVITGGEWWRHVMPIFLHGGLLHFAFNSMFLLQVGRIVEQIYGASRFWVIYLLCGLTGTIFSMDLRVVLAQFLPMRPGVNTVGASGALMGMLGLLIVYSLRHGSVLGDLKRTLMQFGLYMVVLSLVFNMDHLNHLGGLLCGGLCGLVVPSTDRRSPAWEWASLAGVLLVLLAFWRVAALATA